MLIAMPQPAAPGVAAPAGARLRVLVVDEAPPYPPDSGKRLRTWHLLRRLARRHQITLLCYADPDAARQRAAEAALAEAGIACQAVAALPELSGTRLYARLLANLGSAWPYPVAKHHTGRFQAAVEAMWASGRYDLVQVEWTPFASYLSAAVPHLIASHNIEAQIWQRRAAISGRWVARPYFRLQAARMRRFERRVFAQARAVTTVSLEDRATALGWGARRSTIVANGVDVDYFQPRPEIAVQPDTLLFVGALDWFPNQDGVVHFAEAILPLIRAQRPACRFQVVGRRPSRALVQRLSRVAGVELVGEVPDVRPFMAAASQLVVPLRVGGGSRIKIIESLAMDKAVVATPVGAEGLQAVSGTHLLLADTPESFARTAVQLLQTPAQAQRLGRAGGRWARELYNWDDCAQALEAAWRGSLDPLRFPLGGAR